MSLPNGANDNLANLKHCTPTGIPMIVIQQMIPAKPHAKNDKNPPKINHKMFNNKFILPPTRLINIFFLQFFINLANHF